MMHRRAFIAAAAGGLIAARLDAAVEPAGKLYRIGSLSFGAAPSGPDPIDTFRGALSELDWIEGRNFAIAPPMWTKFLKGPIVADAALRNHLPAIGLTSFFARDGLLVAYGPVQLDMYRSAATLIAKILDGARPDVPIERPVHFALVINLKTAKALGLTIPQSLLLPADEVIQ